MTTQKFKWQGIVSKYAYPETWRSLWQVFNSVIPFFVGWYLMVRSLEVGYWLTLLLAVPTAGFMVRCFIIFHDCCHGSFFRSMKANDRLGLVVGVLVLTPFYQWRHSHAVHHATAGDLDRRGTGDVYTMTVEEYLAAPWYKKVGYRIMRSPLILFTVGSFIVFTLTHRFWEKRRREARAQQRDLDQYRDRGSGWLAHSGNRLGGVPAGRSAHPAGCLRRGSLALLRAAQLRPDLLGAPCGVGVLQRRYGR